MISYLNATKGCDPKTGDNGMLIPCMGGWCKSRAGCPNYLTNSLEETDERLCNMVEWPDGRYCSNVEFSGGAPLHGAASAGTQG